MSDQIHDVNEFLGSWGPQPADSDPGLRKVDSADLLSAEDWREMAGRWSEWALEEIAAGHADMAGERARGAYRFCLRYALLGGKPWEGPDAE